MEQVQQLLEILSETPQMALWGLGLYFFFVLAKMASWVTALTYVLKLFINKYFGFHEKKIEQSRANDVLQFFEKKRLSSDSKEGLLVLLSELRDNSSYIHDSDIERAIKILKESKKK